MASIERLDNHVSYLQSYDTSSHHLYELIDSYFDHPILEKTRDDVMNSISIYMCRISTLLGGADQRYLVVTSEIDSHPIGTRLRLSNMIWKSFQTRTIPQYLTKIPKHSYTPKTDSEYLKPIVMTNRYEDHTDYRFDGVDGYSRMTVTLLHKTKNLYEYAERGTLATALETFKALVLIK